MAGDPYAGAIEDYANLEFYIPSVTCEALSNHRAVEYGTPEMSFNEMCAFLRYFGYEVYDMIEIPVDFTEDVVLTFTSPYNYNSRSLVLKLNNTEPVHNPDTNKIAHASEKTLPAAGNPIAVALLALLALGVGGLKRRL